MHEGEWRMSLEENKGLVRQWYEAFEGYLQGDMSALDGLIASNVVNHSALPGMTYDLEGFKRNVDLYRVAFSNIRFAVNDLIAEGDKVVAYNTVSLKHTSEFLGKPATGRQVTMTWIDILRIAESKIVERWGLADDLSLLHQLDAVQPMGQGEEV